MGDARGFADTVTNEDKLGLDKYCEGLGNFILDCETPMTIAIQGKWGSGKSSIFRITEEKVLRTKMNLNELLIIHFDTWMYCQYSARENLTMLLMEQLNNEIAAKTETKDEDKTDSSKIKSNFGKYVLPAIAETAFSGIGGIAGEIVGSIASNVTAGKIEEFFSDSQKQLAEAELLRGLKAAMSEKIKEYCERKGEANRKIVVFVDDLDRMDPVIAVELLEGIKNFLDCEHCVFVLAIDSSVVYDGVYKKYNLTRGNTEDDEKAHNFFDKIIQVPFNMPYGLYDVKKYVESFLKNENSKSDIYKFLISLYIEDNNPRAIKRVFNLFHLNSGIHTEFTSDEEIVCIFLFTLVQVVDNAYYQELIANSNISKLSDFLNRSNEDTDKFNIALDKISDGMTGGDDSDDGNEKGRQRLLTVIDRIFGVHGPFDIFEAKLPRNGIRFVPDVDKKNNRDRLMIYRGNGKLCMISVSGEDIYNITGYGENVGLKFKEIGEHFQVESFYYPERNHQITLKKIHKQNTELIDQLMESLTAAIRKAEQSC